MTEPATRKRLIVCVDGTKNILGQTIGSTNISSIHRFKNLVHEGLCQSSSGSPIVQSLAYYYAIEDETTVLNRIKSSIPSSERVGEDQVESITKDICQRLDSPQDEVFLYGFARGAYIVRAVAGVLHHMGLPKRQFMSQFHQLYLNGLDLYKARCEEDNRRGPKLVQLLSQNCDGPPQIKFVGVFDTTKAKTDNTLYDLSCVSSIHHLRHALALNETTSDPVLVPVSTAQAGRSMIQAWFLGTHQDMGGGTQHDGLSLYPLQWMILESLKAGLFLRQPPITKENVLQFVFPQFTGEVPKLDDSERIEWILRYKNGASVTMFDFDPSHSSRGSKSHGHSVRLLENKSFYASPRKVFSGQRLTGWTDNGNDCTIVHPSVFCLIDRYPRLAESSGLKAFKKQLAEFQEAHLEQVNSVPPWLEGMHLQASGVKAFRILVCGKTGVGKSTLINKIFGVEMTEESDTYSQGVHDINQAFESGKHPGLLIHDSRGWQAGSDQELELIAKFLRHRAFQKNPAEALHVIWFCVDSDVSRIEEADKRTFETIAQYSNQVPVFVVGTKKDKLVAYRKMQLLEEYMEKTGDYKEASHLANEEANKLAEEKFAELRAQLSRIKHYKADGYCCLSKNDEAGVKDLLNQTLGLISDERVRLFCVAAQVVSVDQKIDSAITECMRLSVHAIRTAIVPLPFSGIIGTPTVSRILCEHVLQCFGFPKVAPEAVERIMTDVVMGNLKSYMTVAITQLVLVGGATLGLTLGTMGAGVVLGVGGCMLAAPPAARMLLKCACDMILILERSFRYGGKYVSVRQIADAAKYYTTTTVTTFGGKEILLQAHIHNEVDKLIPLSKIAVGLKFGKLRVGLEEIIYNNRFGKPPTEGVSELSNSAQILEMEGKSAAALLDSGTRRVELEGTKQYSELDRDSMSTLPHYVELEGDTSSLSTATNTDFGRSTTYSGPSRSLTSSSAVNESKGLIRPMTTTDSIPELDDDPNFERISVQNGRSGKSTKWKKMFGLKKSNSAN